VTTRPDLVLVGRGRVGRTLAKRFAERGVRASLLAARGLVSSARARAALRRASVIWIVVPDPYLAEVDRAVAAALEGIERGDLPVVAHASGALAPGALAASAARGACVAVAHPAVSFGTTRTALEGTSFVLDGPARATRRLGALVRALGARPLARAVHGPRYHAALALAANGAAALAALAAHILAQAGLTPEESARLLGPLLRSVADNVSRVGPARALTGPIARGDAAAVTRHLDALTPDERADYVAVSEIVLRAACAGGLEASAARRIAATLSRAQRATR
jgi:predicted short-subunit dehydrogenase-like oxidoreductase (DUF2520 family)